MHAEKVIAELNSMPLVIMARAYTKIPTLSIMVCSCTNNDAKRYGFTVATARPDGGKNP